MNKKCLYSLSLVIVIFITAAVAFAFSVIKAPADQIDRQKVVSQAALTEETATTTAVPTEAPTNETTKEESADQSQNASMDWDSDESYLLAKIAMAEAESEDTEGKALVMLVVLNRVWSNEFPDSIEEVIFQDGQFSPVDNGRFDSVEPDEDCYRALELIQNEKWDESQGALYFESPSASTWHSENLKFLFQHGKHYFYTDKE